jgi:two-component system response regulator PilR (NtrC family)
VNGLKGLVRDVLVLDDEAVARSLLSRIVERCGLVAVQASTLAEARALLARPFLCALIDKNLPDGSGITFMEELHARAPGVPKVLVTAFLDAAAATAAVRAGAVDLLAKPPEVAAVKALLERARAEAAKADALAALLAELDRARLQLAALGPAAAGVLDTLDAARDAAVRAGLGRK